MLYLIIVLLLLIISSGILYFLWQGAIYVPSSSEAVKTMIELSGIKPGKKAADLGSGDGRLLLELAGRGIQSEGFEINPFLYLLSRRRIKEAGVQNLAKVHFRNYWQEDMSRFDAVFVFGISHIMRRLGKKLYSELRIGSGIIANIFPFPNKKFRKKKDGVYLYKV